MPRQSAADRLLDRARAAGFEAPLRAFLAARTPSEERLRVMSAALSGPAAAQVKDALGHWIADTLAVLVPISSESWRSLVHDAMYFVVTHLSDARLAPKLVEQLQLPRSATAERRLLLLIARVPGLQKLGQVLARNRALQPRLRRALTRLENGIRDMRAEQVRAIVAAQLARELPRYRVSIRRKLLSEATVSAILSFTWKNPTRGRRERGVFKVLKPHVPAFYAEDMDLLQGLAEFLKRNHRRYGVGARGLADTFREVRRLLQHEVDFRGEQRQLVQAAATYSAVPGIRVPQLIAPLSTATITAMSEERGMKITRAVRRMTRGERRRAAEHIVQAVVATPMFSPAGEAVFHADPHAGNLLYDRRTRQVVLLDWALVGGLTLDQRRHLMLLFLMVLLRDGSGIFEEVLALNLQRSMPRSRRLAVRQTIDQFLDELPVSRMPDSMDAMGLLQKLAFETVRLPASLILLRKVMFTLEGILDDVVGAQFAVDRVLVRSLFWRWLSRKLPVGAPLALSDWMRLQTSTLLSGTRWCLYAARAAVAG